jgi:hypothetical protein
LTWIPNPGAVRAFTSFCRAWRRWSRPLNKR